MPTESLTIAAPTIAWTTDAPGRITIDGITLETLCVGPTPHEADTIVLLHEGLGCVALWRDFPEKLSAATGRGVFAYSRQGYGQSDPVPLPRPLDYMTCEAVGPLPKLIDAIGLKRGILVGHSDGASIAALYLGHNEDHRINGLVLMAPHFFTEPEGLAAIAAAKIAYDNSDLRDRLTKYHADVDGAFRGWNGAWLDPGFRDWNIEDALDYIRVPVLGIQGRADQYGTLAQLKAMETRLYSPFDALVLEDCRHAPFIDQPDQTLAGIAEFCARLDHL
jgi:pimeloyl-ACP methyl ester carboxylesterase